MLESIAYIGLGFATVLLHIGNSVTLYSLQDT